MYRLIALLVMLCLIEEVRNKVFSRAFNSIVVKFKEFRQEYREAEEAHQRSLDGLPPDLQEQLEKSHMEMLAR